MKKHLTKRLLSLVIAIVMCLGLAVPVSAAAVPGGSNVIVEKVDNSAVSGSLKGLKEVTETADEPPMYADNETVRVSIVLSDKPALEIANHFGISTKNIAGNATVMNYREKLEKEQFSVAEKISAQVLGGKKLDVVWNMTLVANIISANVKYGQIEAIAKVPGVEKVFVEIQYQPDVVSKGDADPNMATSSEQIGSTIAYLEGYTGAGSRIAIIDTGADTDHQSFDNDAFLYALQVNANEAGMTYEEYVESLNLLDAEEIAAVYDELNISAIPGFTPEMLYGNEKLAFGFNYVDDDLNITHDYDMQGEHGSHVAGIATANRYIETSEGVFEPALETVYTQGVAPDAQLITMKVFGAKGGAYESDYMVAIEDAIVLGADAINLSLGSGAPGFTVNDTYQSVLDSLSKTDTVVVMSAGNNGSWADYHAYSRFYGIPYLFAEDVGFHTGGSPGTYTNSLGVASVDNAGFTSFHLNVNGEKISYAETSDYSNKTILTLAGEHEFVFVNGIGLPEEFAAVSDILAGKIALCYRGETSFFEKANAAVEAGAIGVIIVNNQPGIINLDLDGYVYTAPVVSITQSAGEYFKTGDTVTDDEGNALYWTGSFEIADYIGVGSYDSEYYTMSSFSSWGVPGDLSMKPEITAPGGNIYSIFGSCVDPQTGKPIGGSDQYELMSGTSMAAPQVTGMMALLMQYIRENDLSVDGLTDRALAQSLLMSTAVPMIDGNSGWYYPVLQQGSGLANIGAAIKANSYILMGDDATDSAADGKVKAELGDDPAKTGSYEFSFSINNLTDQEWLYELSADIFTQSLFVQSQMLWLDSLTTPINADITWVVNGEVKEMQEAAWYMDFNGDGFVNTGDGQTLLDYAAGMDVELTNAESADLDQDGDVDTYDAYLCLSALEDGAVIVPANGSAEVTVQIQLNDPWLDYYPNGAYVEGYVYAECLATAEGVAGETHSIPVLGFYGNWTNADMFDEVGYVYAGDYFNPKSYSTSFMSVKYAGESGEYIFGGNPIVEEDYRPERNALNAKEGNYLNKYFFTSVRNAGGALLLVTNAETGEICEFYEVTDSDGEIAPIYSAYFSQSSISWKNYNQYLDLGWTGEDYQENDTLNISLVLAPEYYASADGSYDWATLLQTLGEGAYLTIPVTIDNTAPVLVEDSIVIDEENGTLTLTVTDNQYVSAVALYDVYGQYTYTYEGSKSDVDAGATVEYVLDLSEVNGHSFLLQVYDYAMNTTTYKITQQIGEITDVIESVEISASSAILQKGNTLALSAVVNPVNASNRDVIWTSGDESVVSVDENGLVTAVGVGCASVTATSAADPSVSASCEIEVIDINVDLNAIVWDEEGSIWFSKFNTTGLPEYTKLSGDMMETDYFVSAAVGPDGTLYASSLDTNTYTGSLYTIDPVTYEATLLAPCSVQDQDIFYSDLTYAPGMFGTGMLLGTYGPYVIAIDPVTGEAAGVLDQYDSNLIGIAACYGYYDAESNMSTDAVYVIQNNGVVIQEIYAGMYDDGMIVPYYYSMYGVRSAYETGIDKSGADFFNSAYYDDGYLYWSAIDVQAEESVTLYAIDELNDFAVYNLGQFGDDVWPVSGLYQEGVTTFNPYAPADVDVDALRTLIVEGEFSAQREITVEAIEWVSDDVATGSLNAVAVFEEPARPMSDLSATISLSVTAKDSEGNDVASTNGLQVVTYDPANLMLVAVLPNTEYSSIVRDDANGSVTIGYVETAEGGVPAGEAVATLVFSLKQYNDMFITVEHKELGAEELDYVESVTLAHIHAYGDWYETVAPTCTENGEARHDCVHCDYFETRKTEPTGHTYGEWYENVAPTCTENGELRRDCVDCDHYETDKIVATGHTMGEWYVSQEPGYFNLGEERRDCENCDYYETKDIPELELPITPPAPTPDVPAEEPDPIVPDEPGQGCTGGEDCPSAAFADLNVDPDCWYHEAVDYMLTNGLMNGVGNGEFAPDGTVIRGALMTMLARLDGVDTTGGAVWYEKGMEWAVEKGVSDGTAPTGNITREQIITMLWRYAGEPKVEGEQCASYADADNVSYWAADAMNWAVANGIVQGSDNQLNPKGEATRAQLATMFYRYCENVLEK